MDIPCIELKVLYDFEYETRDKRKISIEKGEKLFLLRKTNEDWWQVIKNSSERPFFVPASYVCEGYRSRSLPDGDTDDTYNSCDIDYQSSQAENTLCDINVQCYSKDILLNAKEAKMREDYGETDSSVYQHTINNVWGNKEPQAINANEEMIGLQIHNDGDSESVSNTCKASSKVLLHAGVGNTTSTRMHQSTTSGDEKNVSGSCFSDIEDKSVVSKTLSSRLQKKLFYSRSFKTKHELLKLSKLNSEKNIMSPGTCNLENTIPSSIEVNISQEERDQLCDDRASGAKVSSVAFAFHNELYAFSCNYKGAEKQFDSDNVSSESSFNCEENSNENIFTNQSKESLQDCSNPAADTNKEDVSTYSSNEDVWNISSFDDLPVPEGWKLSYDEEFGEHCYINEVTQAKWFSSTDDEGRVYYFNENASESSWTLPSIIVTKGEDENQELDTDQTEATSPPLRNQDGEKKSRILKARSLFLSDQKQKDASGKSSSIPRNWLQLYDLDKDVVKYGNMNRTKITENGKKISKKWASAYVVLTDDALCFYKDLKSSPSMGLQPEMSMQLVGAKVEPGEKLSSRKHVFLVTSGSLQVLCECETADAATEWRNSISKAIARLTQHQILPVDMVSPEKAKSTPSIERTKSVRVKNKEGVLEDFASNNEEQQTKIRDRLKKFFHRRPTREILASKGIYKDEPVFDSHLSKVCPSEPPFIPEFVKLCINAIEAKEENMKTDGLYRASGNLSHVQKIRLQVDQNNLSVLDTEEDVHVLTGALKLFFRELKEPLIPYELFNKAIDAGGMSGSKKEKTKIFREIVKQLPPPNYDTLKFLLQHLKRVTAYEEFNRMHIPNLAIVFGPTLMWREKEYHQNMAIEFMQQNVVIEFFLQEFDEIFR